MPRTSSLSPILPRVNRHCRTYTISVRFSPAFVGLVPVDARRLNMDVDVQMSDYSDYMSCSY